MNLRNYRWITWAFGLALVGGLVAYPMTSRTALAEEQKNARIHKALDALRDARKELDEAPHDYHGKKKDAMEAVDRAIERLDEIKDW